ncbi:MAG: carboxyltransferase domain-containing protein, partial [Betaproteobacteria bacterium]|nr:carboxyltransferase domain-containing protein [Betaproteobacteria bacterium]
TCKALPWFTVVREKLVDPAYSPWFLHYAAVPPRRRRTTTQPQPFAAEAVAGVRTMALRLAETQRTQSFQQRASLREQAQQWLLDKASEALSWPALEGRLQLLQACYETPLAPDLASVAERTGLELQTVIRLHLESDFVAELIGFMPGFAYLGGLHPALRLPRRDSPRHKVSEGSIAIAGDQSAVYPSSTPGGWHLIGCCPERLFRPRQDPPALIQEGDRVRFERIDLEAFEKLWSQR